MTDFLHFVGANTNNAYAVKNVPSDDLWVGFDIWFEAGLPVTNGDVSGYLAATLLSTFEQDGVFIKNEVGTVQWWTDYENDGPFGAIVQGVWYRVDWHSKPSVFPTPIVSALFIDGVDQGATVTSTSFTGADGVAFGQWFLDSWEAGFEFYMKNLTIGTSMGGTEIWDGDMSAGSIGAVFDSSSIGSGQTLEITTDGPAPPPVDLGPCQSPMWRYVVTDLDTNVVSILDRVASDRNVQTLLDVPNYFSCTVPSDSPLVNIPYPTPTDDPYVAEGDRLMYAFRQEHSIPPYFVCRAAGTILQIEDVAQQDDARTRITAWDGWKLAGARPAQNLAGELPSQIEPLPTGYWDGKYLTGTSAGDIVLDQLLNTITNNGTLRVDAGLAYGGTALYAGTIEATAALDPDADGVVFIVQQGMSVAEVWSAMVNTLTLDVVLTPIFDPVGRPGYTHELNIYVQAGVEQDDDIFGWDRPPHSLIALSRMIDGTQRANHVFFAAGQGGVSGKMAAPAVDATSTAKYGEYWAQQYLPGYTILEAVEDMAAFQLALRKNGRTTIQFSPTPERSPCPFVEYNLGDRVPVYASADGFRQELLGFVRIYGFPIDISDDALESVQGMILLPELA